jgi:hypothetical protein
MKQAICIIHSVHSPVRLSFTLSFILHSFFTMYTSRTYILARQTNPGLAHTLTRQLAFSTLARHTRYYSTTSIMNHPRLDQVVLSRLNINGFFTECGCAYHIAQGQTFIQNQGIY